MSYYPLKSSLTKTPELTWQQELSASFTSPDKLLSYLNLDNNAVYQQSNLDKATEDFSFLVTLSYAHRIQKGNPNDPLLLQVLPSTEELKKTPGFNRNPVGDLEALAVPGLLHKYHGRVLLITTGACPVHCRYCFRRDFPYQQNQKNSHQEQLALNYIKQNQEIKEVILSGGDPLVLANQKLAKLIHGLEKISHLKRIRIHSRVPTTLPSRIDDDLLKLFANTRLKIILVTHANHANELIAKAVLESLNKLAVAKVRLLNQSVLLHRVNDNAETLADLSEALFDAGVSPYYLHLLDKTSGTSHFEVSDSKAVAIYKTLQSQLPGFLVPKLVREIKGEQSKTLQ